MNLAEEALWDCEAQFHLGGGIQCCHRRACTEIGSQADIGKANNPGKRRFNTVIVETGTGRLTLGFRHIDSGAQFIHLGLGNAIVGLELPRAIKLATGIGEGGFYHLQIGTGLTIVQTQQQVTGLDPLSCIKVHFNDTTADFGGQFHLIPGPKASHRPDGVTDQLHFGSDRIHLACRAFPLGVRRLLPGQMLPGERPPGGQSYEYQRDQPLLYHNALSVCLIVSQQPAESST